MRPAARVAAAIEILDLWLGSEARAERLLRDWGRANRYAGSKDRRAISDMVYDCLRRRRSLAWGRGEDGRALMIGWCAAEGWPLDEVFCGDRFAPPPLAEAERAAPGPAPEATRLDHPDWLTDELRRSLGGDYETILTAMQARAPADLRVNRLKASRDAARVRLAREGIETAPVDIAPDALRAAPGAPVARTGAFADGWVEPQDAASQAAAMAAPPAPGEAVLDYCAGGGGKALALAAFGPARVVAHDIDPSRMRGLPARAARAGARIEIRGPDDLGEEMFDLVFVDAPCSGSGAWRRDPEAKWRLSPERLAALTRAQEAAFRGGLARLRPGGRIVYATCSLLTCENEGRAARFAADGRLTRLAERRFSPADGGDGFYCCVFTTG